MRLELKALLAAGIIAGMGAACGAAEAQAAKGEEAKAEKPAGIALPKPRLERKAPLMKALKERRSERNYSERKIPLQQLSDLLWAANGVNRESGKHTSPSPRNMQGVDIYVVLEEGTYVYDPAKHALIPAVAGDHRKATGKQDFVATAPLNLVYVADSEVIDMDKVSIAIPVGCMVQNVALYCASDGLGSVVRGWYDAEALSKALNLRPTQTIYITQTVGFPKK